VVFCAFIRVKKKIEAGKRIGNKAEAAFFDYRQTKIEFCLNKLSL